MFFCNTGGRLLGTLARVRSSAGAARSNQDGHSNHQEMCSLWQNLKICPRRTRFDCQEGAELWPLISWWYGNTIFLDIFQLCTIPLPFNPYVKKVREKNKIKMKHVSVGAGQTETCFIFFLSFLHLSLSPHIIIWFCWNLLLVKSSTQSSPCCGATSLTSPPLDQWLFLAAFIIIMIYSFLCASSISLL